jgi:hypothetical protein
VFDGLLKEPYNQQILDLLFDLAHWHGLAKLRLHTEDTLKLLDQDTVLLGAQFRDFQNVTCASFKTKELERETAARKRRAANAKSPSTTRSVTNAQLTSPPAQASGLFPSAATHPGSVVELQSMPKPYHFGSNSKESSSSMQCVGAASSSKTTVVTPGKTFAIPHVAPLLTTDCTRSTIPPPVPAIFKTSGETDGRIHQT